MTQPDRARRPSEGASGRSFVTSSTSECREDCQPLRSSEERNGRSRSFTRSPYSTALFYTGTTQVELLVLFRFFRDGEDKDAIFDGAALLEEATADDDAFKEAAVASEAFSERGVG